MDRVDELYEMIAAAGGDADSIADSFVEDLNAAIQRYKDNEAELQKKKDADALADHFNAFVETYYPKAEGKVNGDEIIEVWNLATKFLNKEFDLEGFLSNLIPPKEEIHKKKKTLEEMIAEKKW